MHTAPDGPVNPVNNAAAQQLQAAWEALEDAQIQLYLAVESTKQDAGGQLTLLLGRAQEATRYTQILERLEMARREKG
jgi:hypothetical protein